MFLYSIILFFIVFEFTWWYCIVFHRSRDTFYHSELIADDSAAERDLKGLVERCRGDSVFSTDVTQVMEIPHPILWIETAGNVEAQEDNTLTTSNEQSFWMTSRSNSYEALVVLKYLEYLNTILVVDDPQQFGGFVGVITPYNAQVEKLKQILEEV